MALKAHQDLTLLQGLRNISVVINLAHQSTVTANLLSRPPRLAQSALALDGDLLALPHLSRITLHPTPGRRKYLDPPLHLTTSRTPSWRLIAYPSAKATFLLTWILNSYQRI